MEFEQLIKRLDFLEKQQRDSKETLAALKENVASFETTINAAAKQVKTLARQVNEITPSVKRIEQFETALSKQRVDIIKLIEENEKARAKNDKETSKRIQSELTELGKTLIQLKASIISPAEFKKQIKERADETQRAQTNILELKTLIEDAQRSTGDLRHTLVANEEARKNDLKRMADVQGELTALRKRIDETREKSVIQRDTIRNVENRITELLASELERKQAQSAFLDQHLVAQMDRERAWKEWQEKFAAFQKEAAAMDGQVQKLDETLRGAKRAQETYAELNARLERRINEVTEMQRLAEERLRQEWISFKADDQKRWTGHTLSSEEALRDIRRETQKAEERAASTVEITQTLQDQLHQTTDISEKQLQELMNVVHEWMTSYQRIMGHGKKAGKM
jgi:chromosome segregation ATPase